MNSEEVAGIQFYTISLNEICVRK